jgi:GNAT superfamily N-acetyltransferase
LLDAYERHHASVLGGTLLGDREERSRQDLNRHRATTLVMVADAGQSLAGTRVAYLRGQKKDGTRWGYWNRLYVDPSFRGHGIASRLEAEGLRWFRENGVTHIEDRFAYGNWRRSGIRPAYEPVSVESRRSL